MISGWRGGGVQDAHELLLDLINAVSEQLEAGDRAKARRDGDKAASPLGAGASPQQPPRTWVHDLFQACPPPPPSPGAPLVVLALTLSASLQIADLRGSGGLAVAGN